MLHYCILLHAIQTRHHRSQNENRVSIWPSVLISALLHGHTESAYGSEPVHPRLQQLNKSQSVDYAIHAILHYCFALPLDMAQCSDFSTSLVTICGHTNLQSHRGREKIVVQYTDRDNVQGKQGSAICTIPQPYRHPARIWPSALPS